VDVNKLGIELRPTSATPMWEQLASGLAEAILSGRIEPDTKLPSERELTTLGVGTSTASRAIGTLRESGLAVESPGRGIFTARADVIAKAKRAKK